jgi:putative membrane protein
MTEPLDFKKRFDVKPTADSHFSWIRTILSVERTMLAWQRTATGLIGFGFAIVQYYDRLNQMPDVKAAYWPGAPKYLGLALIGCGILALSVSIWQYFWTKRYLSEEPFTPVARMTKEGRTSPTIAVSVVLLLVGVAAFFAVLLRIT